MTVKEELQAAVEELDDRQAEEILAAVRRLRAIAHWDGGKDAEQPRLTNLRGLGKEIWEGVDPKQYVEEERASWDG